MRCIGRHAFSRAHSPSPRFGVASTTASATVVLRLLDGASGAIYVGMKLTAVFEPAKEADIPASWKRFLRRFHEGNSRRSRSEPPRCLEAGSRMPARAGREGAFSAGLARDDRI